MRIHGKIFGTLICKEEEGKNTTLDWETSRDTGGGKNLRVAMGDETGGGGRRGNWGGGEQIY